MKKRKKVWPYKRKSVIYIWLFSYILILIIPLIFAIANQYSTRKLFLEEVKSSNQFILERMQGELDYVWKNINQVGVQVALHPIVTSILAKKNQDPHLNPYSLHQLAKELQVYTNANGAIEQIYIYFKHHDLVVSNHAILDSDVFFNTYYSQLDYDQWSQALFSKSKSNYILFSSKDSKYPVLSYIFHLPMIQKGESDANIFITLSSSFFDELALSMDFLEGRSLYIFTSQGEVLFSTSDIIPIEGLFNQKREDTDTYSYKLGEEEWMISKISSKIQDWHYVLITPISVYLGQLNKINQFFVSGVIIVLLLGISLTLFLIRKNYNPLHDLLEELHQGMDHEIYQTYNEYELISQEIDKNYKEKQNLISQLTLQKNIVKEHIIERLLKGNRKDLSIDDQITSFGLSFISSDFAVMSIYIENIDQLEEIHTEISPFRQMKLIQFTVMNVMEEVIGKYHASFMTEINDMIFCLLNFDPLRKKEYKKDIEEAFKEGQSFLQEHFQIYCTGTLSNIHEGIERIPTAYQEALDTLEYGFIVGKTDLMHYESTRTEEVREYYYPMEEEQKMMNCIKAGDSQQAIAIVEDILLKNHHLISNQPLLSRYLFFDIVATIMKTLYDLSLGQEEPVIENLAMIENFHRYKTLLDFKDGIQDIIEEACEKVTQYRDENSTKFGEEVKLFVQNHYQNEALNISFIADQIGFHPSYVSKLFKEETGTGLLDFINQTRIEAAKDILKGPEKKKLEDVATAVGYGNVRTFMRIFKSYEGVTPGQYMNL